MWMGKAGASTDGDEAATVLRRNSRFIPEAERGWWQATREQRPETMRRSSSGTGGSTGLLDFRRTSWNPLTARWNSPRAKANSDVPEEGSGLDDVADEEGEQLDEDEEAEEGCVRSHARDRSNSVPHLPSLAKGESSSGSEREQLRQKSRRAAVPNTIDLSMTTFGSGNHIHSALPPTPLQLTHINSFTPSLELQRTLPQFASRGYEWRPDPHSKRKGYVPPSHRNPTAMQAFYDTHFGSSSGFRSVAGLADDIFHPIGSARQMLSRLVVVNGKREKKAKQNKADGDRNGAHDEQSKDTLTSWRMMPFSPAIFGMGSSPQAPELSTSKQSASHSASPGAYEPELIPTVHRDPHANRYFKHLEGNVVVLGGYRGSILRDAATHQMIWVPLKVGVGLRRPTLELGLSEEAEERSEELVIADEMLGGVGNMVDTGRRLITRCSRKRTKVHSWGYDWRLSLGRSSARLEAFLLQLWQDSAEKEGDRKGAKVVAHSMGGLVALHALARTEKPQIFESVVFASTPFLGTANILGPFAFGDAALWNDEICSPRATFSFRSSFYLLPVDPRGKEGVDTAGGRCFEEEDGRPHDVDFLDPETWNDLGLSPCVKRGMRPTVLQRAKERADKHGTSLGRQIEHSASQDANLQPTPSNRSDPVKDKADHVPAFPGPDMQMDPASNSQSNAAGVALSEAVKVGHSLAGGQDDSDQTLQPANRQNDNLSFSRKDSVGNTTHDDTSKHNTTPEDEDSISWAYLEKTLADTRKFFTELRTSFKQEYFDKGLYPPMALLTSGRTPTVRGALVWPPGSEALERHKAKAAANVGADAGSSKPTTSNGHAYSSTTSQDTSPEEHWKWTARLCDYSRMLYAPGDGVILRRSATSLPGEWSKLLVRGEASVDEHGANPLTNEEGVVETSHRHVTLLSDVDGVGRCLEACRRGRANAWTQSGP